MDIFMVSDDPTNNLATFFTHILSQLHHSGFVDKCITTTMYSIFNVFLHIANSVELTFLKKNIV